MVVPRQVALLRLAALLCICLTASASRGSASPDSGGPADDGGVELLPREELFDPLLADPRWPHFAASGQWYLDDDELKRVGVPSFGESFALLGGPAGDEGRWELGLHAAVFSIFDFDSESFDLVNSDFLVGLTGVYRLAGFSVLARVFHQSSHLGDEFLLRSRIDRINLSYEVVDLLLSIEPHRAVRLYGGGGYMFHREPSDLEPFSAQGGIEFHSPSAFLGGHLRPVAAFDVQAREEAEWRPDYSARAGLQIENTALERTPLSGLRLQILLEYYDGRSPNGQFFRRDIQYLGVGAHLHY